MKLALAVLVGLLLVANVVADYADDDSSHRKKCEDIVYKCVESDEHCWEEEVCEEHEKACGKEWCTYPEVCKYDTKKVCKNVTKYKKVCADPTYTCQQELTACGDDFCTYDEECVEEEVCKVIQVPVYDHSGPASARASAVATSDGGPAHASAKAVSTSSSGPTYKDETVCDKEYKCAFKDPCKIVYALKCVHAELKEGKSYDGSTFKWRHPWEAGQECGNGYCKEGYKCANVVIKVCPEGAKCGSQVCDPGYKCLEEENCKNVPYITPVCADEVIGVCYKPQDYSAPGSASAKAVAVSNGGSAHASAKAVAKSESSGHAGPEPVCKTVWKCKDVQCGDGYCEAGTACHLELIPCKSHNDDDD